MRKPKVSINIACYNRSKMLTECIESFINQTFINWELILVDDGSEEDLSFVTKLDNRVKYFRQEHGGISKARNKAMDNSIGKYILVFDSDDLASSLSLIEELVKALEFYKEYDVVYSGCFIRGINGVEKRKKFTEILNSEEAYKKMLYVQYIPHSSTLWKKEKMPRYDESLESAVDWELFLTAMENGVKFRHISGRFWTHRTGHEREFNTERQNECCDRLLRKRGRYFDKKIRRGLPL